MIESLDIDNEKATLALQRLLDEHLISELEPGVIGGLHDLRSIALCEETHDDVLNLLAASFHLVLASLTINTIPSVIRCVIARKIIPIDSIYSSLHSHLLQFNNADNWIAIFEGLKATSIDEYVTALGECLLECDFPRSLWHFAAMFSDPKLEIPNIEGVTFFEDLQNVYTCFRKSDVQDHRQGFLNSLKRNVLEPPNVSQISELVGLFSAWAPIIGGDPILPTSLEIKELESDVPIEEVSSLLQTAYFYDMSWS